MSSISERGPEKGQSKVTTSSPSSPTLSTPNPISDQDAAALERKVMCKIDFWLVGFYSFVYIFRVIDSGNYANAAIINLEEGNGIKSQLGFSPSMWSWSQSIFSYSYMLFEPSNTILLKKITPARWMFILILGWGICATCSGATQNFKGMMCVRFAIGLAEAGFYPSVLYHMAFWYKPSEMPWRVALFYSLGRLSSALSGLLAYAISFMNRVGGLSGWRWLFILEGLPAILLAFVALFGVPDYPETARMLTPEEREYVSQRLAKTAPSAKDSSWSWKDLKQLFSSPTVYTFGTYWIGHGIGGFGVNYALPTVIYELGFPTTANSQLMNIPPYVACFGSAYPVIWPERIRALEGTVAAGIGIGLTNALAQFSGICGPHVYNTRFGPTYRVSYIICLCFVVIAISGILVSWVLVRRKDARVNGLEDGGREVVEEGKV